MSKSEVAGVIVPVITPVDLEDRVDETAFRTQLRYLIQSGVHGIFVGGTAGEGPLLTLKEWERMAEIAFDECQGKLHLLGGTIDTSTKRIIERIKILSSIGYEHFVVTPTFYIKVKFAEEHLRLFGECKEAGRDMDMIAYNIPSCTGSSIPVETMCEMVRRNWICCCKDSSEDMDYFGRLRSLGGPLGLRVLIGSELNTAKALRMGVHGLVPVSANYEPSTFLAAYKARDNAEELARIQERITAMVQNVLLEPKSWLAGVKSAVAIKGIGSGKPVSPTTPLDADERARISRFLQNV